MSAVKDAQADLKESLEELNGEAYLEAAALAKKVELPIPFDEASSCEAFLLEGEGNFIALESNFNASEPAVKERSRFQASVRNQEERKRKCNMNVHVVLEYLLSKKALSSGEKLGERTEQFIINRSRWIMGPQADFSASEILLKVAKHVHYIQKTIPTRKSKRGRVPLMKE